MSTKGLGRGLNALFDSEEEVEKLVKKTKEDIADKVVNLKISEVEPMVNQPRKIFDDEKLRELSDSIKEHGVIQPILVIKHENGYRIVSGERRWRASKLAGKDTIPAIVKDYSELKKKQIALIENIQREDLNVIEVAGALKELMDIEKYSVADVAKVTGKSSSSVSNIVRLLNLPDGVQQMMLDGKLVEGQARALLAVDNVEEQMKLAKKIVDNKLTVREVEKIIYNENNVYNVKKKNKSSRISPVQKAIEGKLSEYFGMKVKIDNNKESPKLIIQYYNSDGLESILEKLNISL